MHPYLSTEDSETTRPKRMRSAAESEQDTKIQERARGRKSEGGRPTLASLNPYKRTEYSG